MGLTVALENESGQPLERIEDPTNILHRLLPGSDNKTYNCISTIDWYGDTVFNHLQIKQFLEEWRRLEPDASKPTDTALLKAIENIAMRVANEHHLYLKFYGD